MWLLGLGVCFPQYSALRLQWLGPVSVESHNLNVIHTAATEGHAWQEGVEILQRGLSLGCCVVRPPPPPGTPC